MGSRRDTIWVIASQLCLVITVVSSTLADIQGETLIGSKIAGRKVDHEHLIMLQNNHVTLEDEVHIRVRDINDTALRHIRRKRDAEEASGSFWEIRKIMHIRKVVIAHVRASDDVIEELKRHDDVKLIEANVLYTIRSTGACAQQTTGGGVWGLSRLSATYRPTDYRSAQYRYPQNAGEGVDVYVIDSGVYVDHVDFEGRAVWGYTIEGLMHEGDLDLDGHGTHVAGTVASKTYGVAKKARVIAVKVLDRQGSGDTAGVIEGIVWVYSQDIDKLAAGNGKKPKVVINMSLGATFSFQGMDYVLEAAIIECIDIGMPFVVAAGNDIYDACLDSPARLSGVVTVGATDIHDQMTDFSNFGPCVDIFAPGEDILSTAIGGSSATGIESGTSMAAPHVTGVIAAYLSQISQSPSPYAISAWLFETALKNQILLNNTLVVTSHNRLLHLPCPIDDEFAVGGNLDNKTTDTAILAIVCVIMIILCLALVFVSVVIVRSPTLQATVKAALGCGAKTSNQPHQQFDNAVTMEYANPALQVSPVVDPCY